MTSITDHLSLLLPQLLEMGQVKLQCDTSATVVEHDIKAVSGYFGQACIPGPWVPDNDTDVLLSK